MRELQPMWIEETAPGMRVWHVEVGDYVGLVDRGGRAGPLMQIEALPVDLVLAVPDQAHLPSLGFGVFPAWDSREAEASDLIDYPISPGDLVTVYLPAVNRAPRRPAGRAL